jgi:hypothetical protein
MLLKCVENEERMALFKEVFFEQEFEKDTVVSTCGGASDEWSSDAV